jgi:hypothetical protein
VNFETVNIRASVGFAFMWLAVGWALFLFAKGAELWQLCFLCLLFAAWGIARDVSREGYLHPALVFLLFATLFVLFDMVWMAVSLGGVLTFFAYDLYVSPQHIFVLAGQQLILLTATYAGYLFVRGISARKLEYITLKRDPIDSLWPAFYLVGLAALLYTVSTSVGLAEALENLGGSRHEARAGNRGLILLHYFAYAGILIWYRKNRLRPAWQRYGGIIALSLPLLISGSRTGMLICLLAAAYIDERSTKRINLKAATLLALPLVVFFAFYQVYRGGVEDISLLVATYQDLSMGVGYVIALQEGVIGDQASPGVLWLVLSPIVPNVVSQLIGFPESPNYAFTQQIFPGSRATFSMGVLGEANYILSSSWSFISYFVIGVILTWIGSFGFKKSLLLAAIVAGGAIRVAKGGLTQGGANILILALPIIIAYLVVAVLPVEVKKRIARKA